MTKVVYYATTTEESPPKKFIQSLLPAQKNKIFRSLTYIDILYDIIILL